MLSAIGLLSLGALVQMQPLQTAAVDCESPETLSYPLHVSISGPEGYAEFWTAESQTSLAESQQQDAMVTLRGVLFPNFASRNDAIELTLGIAVAPATMIVDLGGAKLIQLMDGAMGYIDVEYAQDQSMVLRGTRFDNATRSVQIYVAPSSSVENPIDMVMGLEGLIAAALDTGGCTPTYEGCVGDATRICGAAGVLSVTYSCNPQTGAVSCGWTCKSGGGPAGG